MSAIRDTIFNNFLSTYSPSTTRYDSHKKSELRSTYNSIVKLNKESPWFLPVTSKDSQGYAINLKENARELRSEIAEIGGLEEDGLLKGKSAFSSKPDIVEAAFVGNEDEANAVPSFEIEVKSLATPQKNSGAMLESNREATLPSNTYSFDVGINGMNYEFQFAVSDGETNIDIQNRLARLINNSGIGISAEVEIDGSNSALNISSDTTGIVGGRENIFTVSDKHTSKAKGAIDYFGIDEVSEAPSNAEFLLNGEMREANSNSFTVGKMYELKLTGVSEENSPVTVGIKTNTETITDNVNKIVGSYNNFLKAVSTYYETQSRSKLLANEVKDIGTYYSNILNEIGVEQSEDGSLTVDPEKLQNAADSSLDIQKTFGGIKDFSNSLLRKSNQVALNPMEYVQRTVVAYKNPGHNFASPYTTSSYSGMMYNFYC